MKGPSISSAVLALWRNIILFCSVINLAGIFVAADFSASSFQSISDCVHGTNAPVVLEKDSKYADSERAGERIRVPTYPQMIVYPKNSSQVAWSVNCATNFKVTPVPRNGGHSSEGYSSANGSLVIDLSYMDYVNIDPSTSTAIVGGGIRLGPLYVKLDQAGFTIVSGMHPTLGLSGVIAAGGWGLQSRKYGTTGDLVLEAEMVTANGNIITANANNNTDLFWALRGGGGGMYGIVTQWKLSLIPAWPNVFAWHIGYPFSYASQVIKVWTEWAWKETDGLTTTLTITHDGPNSDEHSLGVKIRGHFIGSRDDLDILVQKSGIDNITNITCIEVMNCSNLGARAYFLGDDYNCSRTDLFNVGQFPYASINYSLSIAPKIVVNQSTTTTFSATYNGGAGFTTIGLIPNFPPSPLQTRELEKSKSMFFNATFTVDQLNIILTLINKLPLGAYVEFDSYGGILGRQPIDLTAFPHRNGTYFHLLIGVALTGNVDIDAAIYTWIEEWDTQVRPFSNGLSYYGYVDGDLGHHFPNPLEIYFGSNFGRISATKNKYDANGIFNSSLSIYLNDNGNASCPCTAGQKGPPGPRAGASSLYESRESWVLWAVMLVSIIVGTNVL